MTRAKTRTKPKKGAKERPASAPRKAPAREDDYSAELAERICDFLAEGWSLTKICKEEGYPNRRTVYRWRRKYEEFDKAFLQAREDQADYLAEDIIEIADDTKEHPQRARNRIDARKWYAAKLRPRVYGDRVTNELEPSESFTGMMRAFLGEIDGTSRGLPKARKETR